MKLTPDGRVGVTGDEAVNLLIAVSQNLKGTSHKGKVSDFVDVARRSTRLRFEDHWSREGPRAYACVAVPFRGGERAPVVTGLSVSSEERAWMCRFSLGERDYRFVWEQAALRRE